MKKIIFSILAIAILAGCGGETRKSTDELYMEVIRENTNITAPDSEVISLGHEVCDLLNNGVTVGQLIAMGVVEDLGKDYSFFVGASIGAYCPEYA